MPCGIIFATEVRRKNIKWRHTLFPRDYERKRSTAEIRICCKRLHQFLLRELRGIRVFHLKQSPKHRRTSTTIKYMTKLGQDRGFAVRFLTLWSWISWRESFFALPSYVPYPWLSKENMTEKYLTPCLSISLSIWLSLCLQKHSENKVERESFHSPLPDECWTSGCHRCVQCSFYK